jgi:PAS domain-containing protein
VAISNGALDVATSSGDGRPAPSGFVGNLAGRLSSIGQAVLAFGQGDGRFREVIEALPAAIYTTDKAGRITFYNEAAEVM